MWEKLFNPISGHIAKIIQMVWAWQWDRNMGQRDRIHNPEIVPHKYDQQYFDIGAQQFNGEKIVSSTNKARAMGCTFEK